MTIYYSATKMMHFAEVHPTAYIIDVMYRIPDLYENNPLFYWLVNTNGELCHLLDPVEYLPTPTLFALLKPNLSIFDRHARYTGVMTQPLLSALKVS